MEKVLFNFHDAVLLITVGLCLITAVSLVKSLHSNRFAVIAFVLFSIASLAIPLDTLINFGAAFRDFSIRNLPNWFYVFELGFWLQGPFLLLFIRSVLYRENRLTWLDASLFVPYLLFLVHQIFAYYSLPSDTKVDMLKTHTIQGESFSVFYIVFLRETLRFCIFCYCIYQTRYYFSHVEKNQVSAVKNHLLWLEILVYSLTVVAGVSLFNAALIVLSFHGLQPPIEPIGLIGNYLHCLSFAAVLAFLNNRPVEAEKISINVHRKNKHMEAPINNEHIDALEQAMVKDKLYLECDLTLEVLASHLNISSRSMSNVINRHYHCNFFEYINSYRIEEAKVLMKDEQFSDCTILDIMYKAGFNSKATFNAFFKKTVGMTPRQYRKSDLSNSTHLQESHSAA
ncbi:Melibiose operon regulatory protein [Thalassocella blandensis]|nr:Melibiose operon regulatory protein [Thalassocella blandensis]